MAGADAWRRWYAVGAIRYRSRWHWDEQAQCMVRNPRRCWAICRWLPHIDVAAHVWSGIEGADFCFDTSDAHEVARVHNLP
jgi:hypothetical protein